MNQKDVIEFFDSLADTWDEGMIREKWKIDCILDTAKINKGSSVLDVACGTGVLIPDYISRGVHKCTAVDVSEKMIEIARKKFSKEEIVEFLCADAESCKFKERYDSAVIYNAFPHFVNPDRLFQNISLCLKEGGRITVAHGMSREALTKHHSGRAERVSVILPEAYELAEIMSFYFDVDTQVSTDEIYIVSGTKKILI